MNPFPGLRPFQTHEKHLFFGREAHTAELLRRLRTHRFLAVVGTSGSGKSSLVRAGLLPELYGGSMASAGSHWDLAVLRPGGDPILNLAAALVDAGLYPDDEPDAVPGVRATLSRSSRGLIEAVRQSGRDARANVLLVVDQFEEVFRFRQAGRPGEDAARLFVSLLLEAAEQTELPIYVVLTMRSDYLGDCAQFRGLAEAVNQGEYLIPQLNRDQLCEAITGPARVGGAALTPRLLQSLVNDAGQDADQLPILQHALMRTWDAACRTGAAPELIDLPHYREVGGTREALSRHADEIFHRLESLRLQEVAARLFKGLTERGADNRGIRRPTRVDQLSAIIPCELEELTTVIEPFRQPGCTFLMPFEQTPLTPDTVIDISHESLMRCWDRLRRWVEEEAQSVRIYRRLVDTASLHAEGKADLYHDPDLQIALTWREQVRPTPAWAARIHPEYERALAFLELSAAAREADHQAHEAARQRELHQAKALAELERSRAEEQLRASHRLRWLVRGLGVVAMVALAALAIAIAARKEAESNARAAANNAELARQEAERADAEKSLARRVLYAADMNLAQQAHDASNLGRMQRLLDRHRPESGEPDLRDWEWRYLWQLGKGDQTASLGPFGHHVFNVGLSPDNRLVLVTEFNGRISLWDKESRTEIAELQPQLRRITSACFSPDGRLAAAISTNGSIRLWEMPSRRELPPLLQPGEVVSGAGRILCFNDRGTRLACYVGLTRRGSGGTEAQVWDLETRSRIATFLGSGMNAHMGTVCLTPDGGRLFYGGPNGRLIAIDLASNKQVFNIQAAAEGLTVLACSPDGRSVASGSGYSDGRIRVWDADTGQEAGQPLSGHTSWVCGLEFSRDGKTLVSSSADQTVRLWDMENRAAKATLRGHKDEVYALDLAADGQTLVTGDKAGMVHFYTTLPPTTPPSQSRKRVGNLAPDIAPDGQRLLVASERGSLEILDARTLEVLESLDALGTNYATGFFAPDGKSILIGERPPILRTHVVDLASRAVTRTLTNEFVVDSNPAPGLFLLSTRQPSATNEQLTLILRDASTLELRETLTFPRGENPLNGAYHARTRLLAAGYEGADIRVSRLPETGALEVLFRLTAHRRNVSDLAFSPDGKYLASGGEDGKVFLWDLQTGRQRAGLHGHLKGVHAVQFSPNGRRVATGSGDAEAIKLWDIETGQELLTLPGQGSLLRNIRFSPDGNLIVGVAWNVGRPVLHVWQAPPLDDIATLEQVSRESPLE